MAIQRKEKYSSREANGASDHLNENLLGLVLLQEVPSEEQPEEEFDEKNLSLEDLREIEDLIREAELLTPDDKTIDDLIDDDDEVGLYFKQALQYPLLTAEEEIAFGRQKELGLAAERQLAGLDYSLPGNSDQISELGKIVHEGKAAYEIMVLSNTRLVVSVAKKYFARQLGFLDLVQEGNIGLLKAIKKFDSKKGRITTYAVWWIRQGVRRAIHTKDRTIKLSQNASEIAQRAYRVRNELTQSLGRQPSDQEVAKALDVNFVEYQMIMDAVRNQPISYHLAIGPEQKSTIEDLIPDENFEGTRVMDQSLNRKITKEMLEHLPPRERFVVSFRYGVGESDGAVFEFEEIAELLAQIEGNKLTSERIRQINKEAIRRLQLKYIDEQKRLGKYKKSDWV